MCVTLSHYVYLQEKERVEKMVEGSKQAGCMLLSFVDFLGEVWIYEYIYVYIYVCIYVYTYIYIYICIYLNIWT
jgi:hypothetical protein